MARILVIEDDPSVRGVLKELLENEGYEVLDAGDGQAGLDLCRESPFDLVIADLFMPVKGGLETIMELHQEYPNVKIIAISGVGFPEPSNVLDMAKRFGAEHTFAKPFNMREFLLAVRRTVED